MARGMFPCSKTEASELVDAKMLLLHFINSRKEEVADGSTGKGFYDAVARDGGYIAKLRLAVDIIEDCMAGGA
jgi:hypothetical protein